MTRTGAWSEDDKTTLRQLWLEQAPIKVIAHRLVRPYGGVYAQIKRMGLGERHRPWSDDDDAILRIYWTQEDTRALAKRFGRSPASIRAHGAVIGLPSRTEIADAGRRVLESLAA